MKENEEKKKQQATKQTTQPHQHTKKGNKNVAVCVRVCTREQFFSLSMYAMCMFLLHLFGTVASVQLKTLFRSHRLLCNGIAHNAHIHSHDTLIKYFLYEYDLFDCIRLVCICLFYFGLFSN